MSDETKDLLDTVPAEERPRILALAEKARGENHRPATAPWAGQAAYDATVKREVAAYHARPEIDTIIGNLRFAIRQAGAGGTVAFTTEMAGKALDEIDRRGATISVYEDNARLASERINEADAEVSRLRAEAESDRGMHAAQLANVAEQRDEWKAQASANAHGHERQRVFREAAEAERDNLRIQLQNERSSPVWAIIGEVQTALGLPDGAVLGAVVAVASSVRAERDDLKERLALCVADEPTGVYQEGLAAGRRENAAEVDRLNGELAKLGALKSAEIAPVIERFREAFGADVPQAPSGKPRIEYDHGPDGETYRIKVPASVPADASLGARARRAAQVYDVACVAPDDNADEQAWLAVVRFCDTSRPVPPLSDVDADATARRLLAEMGIRDDAHVDRIARALQDVADGGRGHCDGSKRREAFPDADVDTLLSEAAAIAGMQGPPEMKRAAFRGSLLMVTSGAETSK